MPLLVLAIMAVCLSLLSSGGLHASNEADKPAKATYAHLAEWHDANLYIEDPSRNINVMAWSTMSRKVSIILVTLANPR